MATTFTIKRNDTSPQLRATLYNADGTPVDLTGSTVRMLMSTAGGRREVIDAAMVVEAPATDGVSTYQWEPEDTAEAGAFIAEVEVTFPTGKVGTFPNGGYIDVRITSDLG